MIIKEMKIKKIFTLNFNIIDLSDYDIIYKNVVIRRFFIIESE